MDMLDVLERRVGLLDEPRARSALLCLLQDAQALRRHVRKHGTGRGALGLLEEELSSRPSPETGSSGRTETGSSGLLELGTAETAGAERSADPLPGPVEEGGLPDWLRNPELAVRRVEEELRLQEEHGVKLLVPGAPGWPAALDGCVQPPVLLYVRGVVEVLHQPTLLALVGSRHGVGYGVRVATSLASAWARMGGGVVSGGAIGVDTAAHEGCLAGGGATVAVMGTGLGELHPRRNLPLFCAISETGAVASELPMRSRALPFNFPQRNRLIAALARAVVVVQARRDSGALHTARFALKTGRLLFTVPAPVDEESCLGGLDLLVQGVPAMTGTEQLQGLFAQMTGRSPSSPCLPLEKRGPRTVRLSDVPAEERGLLERLSQETCHIDDLGAATGLEGRELALLLLSLEMRGWVEKAPGNRYISLVRLER